MKAKDKAKELVEKYINIEVLGYKEDLDKLVGIECVKIAVDEIINQLEGLDIEDGDANENRVEINKTWDYWQEVKNELNNM